MSETEDYDKSATPTLHASTHENGGSDEISVAGLSGVLADPQTPAAHKTSHQDAGSDEISVAGLSGTLADPQTPAAHHLSHEPGGGDQLAALPPAAHKTSHQDGGSDEISVAGLSGTLADPQTPAAHKTSHQDGGSDEISVAGLSGALADPQTPAAHKTSHQDAGSDEISVAGLSGTLADPQTPAAHKTSHQDAGADEISIAGLAGVAADLQKAAGSEGQLQINISNILAADSNLKWDNTNKTLRVGTALEIQTYDITTSWIAHNAYRDNAAGSFKYRADGLASMIYFTSNQILVYHAASGLADAVITWKQILTFHTSLGFRNFIIDDTNFDTDEVLDTGITAIYGLLLVRESTAGILTTFLLSGQTIQLQSSTGGNWSTTKDTGGNFNVYWETNQFKVQNKVGDNKNIRVALFGIL